MRLLTALLIAFNVFNTSASADATIPLQSIQASQWYSWCGKSATDSVSATPTPSAQCGLYSSAGSVSTATLTFGSHGPGKLATGVYMDPASRPVTASLMINGSSVSTQTVTTKGWTSFPKQTVAATDTIAIYVKADWYGSGTAHLYGVSADLVPWQSPDWSQFGTPGNWATTPVPQNVQTYAGASPYGSNPLSVEVPKELQGEATAQSYVNENSYSAPIYYQPLNTPNQPVKLCQWWNAAGSNCVANGDLWRAFMGLPESASPNWQTGACASNCTSIGGGVPMTSDVIGATGTDGSAVICLGGGDSGDPPWTLPNFTRPDGQKMEGNCWEMWNLRQDPSYDASKSISPTNTKYEVAFGQHLTGFITQPGSTPDNTYGHQLETFSGKYCPRTAIGQWKCGGMTDALAQTWFGPDANVPGAADSTTELGSQQQGVTAAETPLLTDVVQQHDCTNVLNGASNFGHAIGVQVQYSRSGLYGYNGAIWPAGNSDGNNAHMALAEGMRLVMPSTATISSSAPRSAKVFFANSQKYGIVIDDTTGGGPSITYNADGSYASGGAVNIRVQPTVRGQPDDCHTLGMESALQYIPWSQMKLIQSTQGNNDALPNPTTP